VQSVSLINATSRYVDVTGLHLLFLSYHFLLSRSLVTMVHGKNFTKVSKNLVEIYLKIILLDR